MTRATTTTTNCYKWSNFVFPTYSSLKLAFFKLYSPSLSHTQNNPLKQRKVKAL